MGAWIETHSIGPNCSLHCVAPYMGAWIETEPNIIISASDGVAPYMGAWIETVYCAELLAYT